MRNKEKQLKKLDKIIEDYKKILENLLTQYERNNIEQIVRELEAERTALIEANEI